MKLWIPITINVLLVAAVYLAQKRTRLREWSYRRAQALIGILFGASSCLASELGVEVLGTVANIRDAAPLSAGLIFGAPSGIMAGIIGGVYRWFSVFWGAGEYTRLACTVATILAGFLAAALRKFMFDNKKPTWSYAVVITVLCEVLHMLLIFLTNMRDPVQAFGFVRGATVPMIIGNVVAVGVALIIVSLLSRERGRVRRHTEHIAETFQRWLLVCILVAFLITSLFTYVLQNGMVSQQTQETFDTAIEDVSTDVRGKSDANLLSIAKAICDEYNRDPSLSLVDLAAEYGVAEINVVSSEGIITASTNEAFEDFDMNDTDQSREFMRLTRGAKSLVQEYGPMGNDQSIWRKYAGVALDDGGFIQVGYSAEQFHEKLDQFVIDVTKNRHVGTRGFVAVCDENLCLVTETARNGNHISTLGIKPNAEMRVGEDAIELCETTIVNGDFREAYIYKFVFVEGYCIIAAMPEEEVVFMRDASLYTSVFMQVLIFAVLFVFIYILIKRVIINNLRRINGSLSQITEGNLNVTVDVRSNEEFASLSDDINSTVDTLKRYIDEAAARIDRELEYAKQIQLSALPTRFPDAEDYTARAQMIAAREVGGDFYDFYTVDERTVAFLVADVSGKGIPAAMFMMTAKTIIKDLTESGIPVNEILTRANAKLCESNESGMFVTAWMGILDLPTGRLQYANAGHNPPLLGHRDGSFSYLRSRAGFVLAGMDGVRYRVNELTLAEGDRLFLYTDGVTEATDTEDRLYGEDRLLSFMERSAAAGAEELLPLLKADIDAFVGDAPQFDDITMLILDYHPQKGGVNMTEKSFPARDEALGEVLGFAEAMLEQYECPMKTQVALCVALEEVFVNVAHYAYGGGEGEVKLAIGMEEESRTVTLRMSDGGVPFDPLQRPDPDITLSAEEREIGGLGIFITKKTMDTVEYAYENGENVLTMTKKI